MRLTSLPGTLAPTPLRPPPRPSVMHSTQRTLWHGLVALQDVHAILAHHVIHPVELIRLQAGAVQGLGVGALPSSALPPDCCMGANPHCRRP